MYSCNAPPLFLVIHKSPLMLRLFVLLSIAMVMLVCACSKSNTGEESVLYGSWVNNGVPGDTLQFMHKNNRDVLRFNNSFNPTLPVYTEVAYTYKNGKLQVGLYGAGEPLKAINSFIWKQPSKEFDILGYQLYLFMSSSVTHFTYTKIN